MFCLRFLALSEKKYIEGKVYLQTVVNVNISEILAFCGSLQCRRIFGKRTLSSFFANLGFSKQRNVGERWKFLPRGWSIGERKEEGGRRGKKNTRLSLTTPSLSTFT